MSSTRLPSTYQSAALDATTTVSRDNRLAAQIAAPQDDDYVGDSSQFLPRMTSKAEMPFDYIFNDVSPKQGTVTFNSTVTFEFGHEGPALLHRAELIFTIGAINNGSNANIKWQSYIGERFIGDELVLKYNTNIIKRYSQDFMHYFNRLRSKAWSASDAGYQRMVGADLSKADCEQANTFRVPICLPTDGGHDNCLVTSALAEPIRLDFRVPTFLSLIKRADHTDGVATGTVAVAAEADAPSISVKLRVWQVDVPVAFRSALAKHSLTPAGFVWNILDNEEHSDVDYGMGTGVAGTELTDEVTKTVRLYNLKNPVVALFGTIRYKADLMNAVIGAATTAVPAALAGVSSGERFQAQPYLWVEITENGQKFTPRYSYQQIEEDIIPNLLNCESGDNIFVIPFAREILDAANGNGHKTLASLNNPEFKIASIPRPGATYTAAFGNQDPWNRSLNASSVAADAGVSRGAGVFDKRLDIWGLVRNRMQHVKGHLTKFYL